jgi:ferredoxin-NADP reductase
MVVLARDTPAEGVVRLVLGSADGAELPHWQPGAHIDLVHGEVVRQYSLAGDPADRTQWQIAVLLDPESRGGSAWVHASLSRGAHVVVRGPRNHFPLRASPEYLFIAGGIGITPIYSMVAAAQAAGATWKLVYGGRSRRSMAYLSELTALASLAADDGHHPTGVGDGAGRLVVVTEEEHGLIPVEQVLGEPRAGVAVYACGPEPLLQAVEQACAGWPVGALHVERFAAKPLTAAVRPDSFEVQIAGTGQVVVVPPEVSVLEALIDAGLRVPSSCREGTCGTCEVMVVSGVVDHRDSILNDAEKAANDTMFVCVSRAISPRLVLDV